MLTANFRSSSAVIDWVNDVFSAHRDQPRRPTGVHHARRVPPGPAGPRHGPPCSAPTSYDDDDSRAARELREREAELAWPPPSPPRSPRAGPSTTTIGGAPAVRARRHLRPAPGPHVAAGARGRPRERGVAVPGRELARSCTLAPEIRDLLLASARRRRSHRRAGARGGVAHRRSTAAATSSCTSGDGRRPWSLLATPPRRSTTTPSPRPSPTCARSPTDRRPRRPPTCSPQLVDERRVLDARPRRARRPRRVAALRYVIDQARAWADAGGHGAAPLPALGASRRPRAGSPTRSCPSTTTTRCGS